MNKDFNTSVEREREMFVGSLSILLVLMSPIQWNYVMQTTASPFSFFGPIFFLREIQWLNADGDYFQG
jgi:hypothetical protein